MAKRKLPAGVLSQAKKQARDTGSITKREKQRMVKKISWNVCVGDLIQFKTYDYTASTKETIIRTGFVIKVPKETKATSMTTAYRDQALVMSSKGREYVPMNMIKVIQNVVNA